MKKWFLVLLCICLFISVNAYNKTDYPPNLYRNELSIGGSLCSGVGLILIPSYIIANSLGATASGDSAHTSIIGCYVFNYRYYVKTWLSFGLDCTFEGARIRNYSQDNRQLTGARNLYTFAVMPAIRFSYLNRPVVRLYSGLQAGCYMIVSTDVEPQLTFGGNITLFGVSVGKRLFGYAEINFGMKGLVQAGLGYRF